VIGEQGGGKRSTNWCIQMAKFKDFLLSLIWVFQGLLLVMPVQAQDSWCQSPAPPAYLTSAGAWDRAKELLTIPVVVHVVWSNPTENINDEQILSQLAVLNEHFRALNADLSEVWVEFQDDIADLELNFALATVDPQGQATSGINRVMTTVPTIGGALPVDGRRPVCHTDLGGSDAWFPGCYLNIWVCALPEGIAGQGTFPGSVPLAEDGVFVAPDRFGTTGTVTPPFHLGRTLTHEIGHWLNLFHPWGPENLPQDPCPASLCCNDELYDDFVADTPKQVASYTQSCPSPPQQTCGSRDMFQNFMSLSNDPCLLFFTPGQKERAWQAIQDLRPGLLDNTCITATEQPERSPWLLRHYVQGNQLWLETGVHPTQWQLFDLSGRPVLDFQLPAPGQQAILLPHLPAGVYWLWGRYKTEQITKKVIIVNH
jgi:hypothetical protein